MPSDKGHRLTEEELSALERRISDMYKQAADELTDTINGYFAQFNKRDERMRGLIGQTVDGREWTEQDYKRWRLNQMGRGERYRALQQKLASRMTDANEVAMAYINDVLTGIYTLNRNYSAYKIEGATGSADFTLWDEATVRRLATEQPDLMPYYPPERAIKRKIDLDWGKKQITKSVTSGLLQGKSTGKIASDLKARIEGMNRDSAVRAARTAITGAENAGRMDTYAAAQKMGIKLKKEWLATLDNRTRHAHAMLDGQKADVDKPFRVDGREIRFPGDPQAHPSLVYNCRCTLVSQVDGADTSGGQRRARDPATGKSVVVSDMSFSEWEARKKAENATAWEAYIKKGENYSSGREQFSRYKERLGTSAPESFEKFQNLKYNDSEAYNELKEHYRYKGRVPEATKEDFQKYLKVKKTGVAGTIRVPPERIDVKGLSFRDEHAARHGCTVEEARSYVENSVCSIRRSRWDGVSINFYSANGAAYLDSESLKIKTAYSKKDFDSLTNQIVEASK